MESEMIYTLQQVLKGRGGNTVSREDIQMEINRSLSKVDHTKKEIQQLCANNYTEFLQTLKCTQELKSTIGSLKQNVGKIHQNLDMVESHYFKDAQELQQMKDEVVQVQKARK